MKITKADWINGIVWGIALALVFALVGCALTSGDPIPAPKAGDANTKAVARVLDIVGEQQWQRTGYWRIDDTPGWPWNVIVATDGTGCPVLKQEVRLPHTHDYYSCKVQWRIRRPV